MKKTITALAAAVTMAAALTACGGGGGAGTGVKTVKGKISGFGSVIFAGVEYESDIAEFVVEGMAATEDDLRIGFPVIAQVDAGTSTLIKLVYSQDAAGALVADSGSVTGDTSGYFQIPGYTINWDTAAATDPTKFEDGNGDPIVDPGPLLTANTVVQIIDSTPNAASCTLDAIKVVILGPQVAGDMEAEVKGSVDSITGNTFNLDQCFVVDASAADLSDFGGAMPNVGDYVKVKSETGFDAFGQLIAKEIEDWEGLSDDSYVYGEGEEVELEDVEITIQPGTDNSASTSGDPSTTASEFYVGDQKVIFDANTVEWEGGDETNLTVGAVLSVEGSMDADNNLIAEEISFGKEGDIEYVGILDAVSGLPTDPSVVPVSGVVTVFGVDITIEVGTEREDESVADEPRFNLGHLVSQADADADLTDAITSGDYVKVEFYYDAVSDSYIATEFKRLDAPTVLVEKIEGVVTVTAGATAGDPDTYTVGGVNVISDGIFDLTTLTDGSEVELDGTFNGTSFVATGVSVS